MQRGSSRSDHGPRVRRLALTCVIASSTAVLAGQTLAQKVAAVPAASELVASSRQAKPIPAWTEFCKRYPTECTVDASQPATIILTALTWSTILEVNRRVNKSVRSLPDRDHWGVADAGTSPRTASEIARTSSFLSASCWLRLACSAER